MTIRQLGYSSPQSLDASDIDSQQKKQPCEFGAISTYYYYKGLQPFLVKAIPAPINFGRPTDS